MLHPQTNERYLLYSTVVTVFVATVTVRLLVLVLVLVLWHDTARSTFTAPEKSATSHNYLYSYMVSLTVHRPAAAT
jgi:uncharacterized membrane protein